MKNLHTFISTIALLVLILAGCTSVSHTILMPNLPPVFPENVQIFLSGDSIPPHDWVAIWAGSGSGQ